MTTSLCPAFPPFEKGGQGGFALDAEGQRQIPLYPPFSKGERSLSAVVGLLQATNAFIVGFADVGTTSSQPAFPPFEKGGQGGFAPDVEGQRQIPLYPPFSKGEKAANLLQSTNAFIVGFPDVGMTSSQPAFPPFEKGGQGGFALDVGDQTQIPLSSLPFSKGETA